LKIFFAIFQSKRTLRRRATSKLDELINEVGITNEFGNDAGTANALYSQEQQRIGYGVEDGRTSDDHLEHERSINDFHLHMSEEITGKFTAIGLVGNIK